MRLAWLAAVIALAGCLDSVGPRPRPGGSTDTTTTTVQPTLQWYELQPRVITQGLTDSVLVTVAVKGNAEIVDLDTRAGFTIGLPKVADGVFSGKVATSILLFGYRVGDLHSAVGFIELFANGETTEHAFIVNVKDATVPTADPLVIVPGMQITPHVVNIRYDSIFTGGAVPAAPLKTFYSQFGDEYTFAAVIEQVQTDADHSFTLVKNDVHGIGLPIFDNSARYGSTGALEGILNFPNDATFDPAESSNLHEIAHRWMNHLTLPSLVNADAHWPLSDLANGILGWSDSQTHEQLLFPFDVQRQSNGTYQLHITDTPRTFNDLELYLAGLLPADSVQPHVVFLNQDQTSQVRNLGILQGPVDSVTIADIVGKDGPRIPSAASAPRQFKLVTIVLSRGGNLTRDEMSFFEHMAARGEQTNALTYFNGQIRSTTLPFFGATNGRAMLITKLGLR